MRGKKDKCVRFYSVKGHTEGEIRKLCVRSHYSQREGGCSLRTSRKRQQALVDVTSRRVPIDEVQSDSEVAVGCADRAGETREAVGGPDMITISMCMEHVCNKTAQIKDVVSRT